MSTENGGSVKIAVTRVHQLRANDRIFESWGYSRVKVTRDGQPQILELPIRSTGVAEVMERLRSSEPKPPFTQQYVTADSPAGRQMKLTPGTRQWARMPDYGDAAYVAAREKFEMDMVLEVLNTGLAVDIVDQDGNVIPPTNRDGRIAALRALGLSTHQFNQVVADISELTQLSDRDRENFFEPSSDAVVN